MPITRQSNEELIKKLDELATKKDIDQLKDLIKSLHERIDNQNLEIANLKEKIANQIVKTSELEDKVGVLSAGLSQAIKKGDDSEQYSRRYCLRIKGIESGMNESGANCVDKVVEVCKKLNVDIAKEDIDRAHRVGKDRDTMIVKFYSFTKRTLLYRARKRNKKFNIFLDITKTRLNVLDEARKNIKKNSRVDFVFADINCNLVAKLKNGSFKFFYDVNSFLKIVNVDDE